MGNIILKIELDYKIEKSSNADLKKIKHTNYMILIND